MARIPKLDSAGRFLAADVNGQIDARTKATMRADLPALAKELKIGGVDGSVPIFPTLAEAQAWEAKNPGKKALTLEPSTPDTTPPTPGTLSVNVGGSLATLSVIGASDDRAVSGYAFKINAGAWTAWQEAPDFTASGLAPSTSYTFQHKVRDKAGNETAGEPVSRTTAAFSPGTLTASVTSTTATLTASGASAQAVEYAFKVGAGAWSAYQPTATFAVNNLSPSTTYTFTHRVRSADGMVATGAPITRTTEAKPIEPGDVLASDGFSGDGPLSGRTSDSAFGGSARSWAGGGLSNWSTSAGALVSSASTGFVGWNMDVADYELEIKINSITQGDIYLDGRRPHSNNAGNPDSVRVRVEASGHATIMVRHSGGTTANLGAGKGDLAKPYKVTVKGSSVTVSQDGVVIASAAQTNVTEPGFIGLGYYNILASVDYLTIKAV